jgi:hypothetical protein
MGEGKDPPIAIKQTNTSEIRSNYERIVRNKRRTENTNCRGIKKRTQQYLNYIFSNSLGKVLTHEMRDHIGRSQ